MREGREEGGEGRGCGVQEREEGEEPSRKQEG